MGKYDLNVYTQPASLLISVKDECNNETSINNCLKYIFRALKMTAVKHSELIPTQF